MDPPKYPKKPPSPKPLLTPNSLSPKGTPTPKSPLSPILPKSPRFPLKSDPQKRFFQWSVNWFFSQDLEANAYGKVNAPNLINLHQALGFQLKEFEISKESLVPQDSLRVTIQCGSSKLKAVLEIDGIECQCPSSEDIKEAAVWTSVGTDPSINDNLLHLRSGTSLIPELPMGVSIVVKDVALRLFKEIEEQKRTPSSPQTCKLSYNNIKELAGILNVENVETLERLVRTRIQLLNQPPDETSGESPIQISIEPPSETSDQPPIENFVQPRMETSATVAKVQFTETQGEVLSTEAGAYSLSSDTNSSLQNRLADTFLMNAKQNLDEAIRILSLKSQETSPTPSFRGDFFNNPPPPTRPGATSGSSPNVRGPPPAPPPCIESRSRSSTFTSDKTFLTKHISRRSAPTQIPKTVEKSTTSVHEKTPVRRRSGFDNSSAGIPSKTNSQRKLPVTKTILNSSMNALSLSGKKQASPISPNFIKENYFAAMRPPASTSGASMFMSAPFANTSGAFASTSGAFASTLGAFAPTSGAFASTSGAFASTSGASRFTSGPATSISGPATSTSGPATSMSGPLATSTLRFHSSTFPIYPETSPQTSKGTPGKGKNPKYKKGSKDN